MLNVPAPSRAGSLPQGLRVYPTREYDCPPCGSGLARDDEVSGDANVECAGPFASKPAPTRIAGVHDTCTPHNTPVGAGLPAMTECQAMQMLNVPAPSRAGSLPQGSRVYPTPAYDITPCGSEPAREGGVSGHEDVECAGPFADKPAPTRIAGVHDTCTPHNTPVGAGLPAISECQAMKMLNAEPRPQVLRPFWRKQK
ncbi:hypothetical protein SAMN04490206_3510 [Pseudomonas umsongensis]|nr:hypothetical protein SAMN04490206_3510 [Pseudomonas umsongensis]